jgi:hypothetical protein
MLKGFLKRHGYAQVAKAAVLTALSAALGWNASPAAAARRVDVPQSAPVAEVRVQDADLEELFWICDHAAVTRMVGPDEVALCSAVSERLLMERFGGDSEQLLEWWRENKAIEHRRLDRGAGPRAAH